MKNLEKLESDLEFLCLMKKARQIDIASFHPFALKKLKDSNPSKFKELAEEAEHAHDMQMREMFEEQERIEKLMKLEGLL